MTSGVLNYRGKATVYKCIANPFRGKIQTSFLCHLYITLPSKELCEAYEAKRQRALDEFYEKILRQQREKEERTYRAAEKRKEIIEQIKREYLEGRITLRELGYEIMERLGISQGPAYKLRRRILKEIEEEQIDRNNTQ